eukprot:1969745-Rhodomonas_salina.1
MVELGAGDSEFDGTLPHGNDGFGYESTLELAVRGGFRGVATALLGRSGERRGKSEEEGTESEGRKRERERVVAEA